MRTPLPSAPPLIAFVVGWFAIGAHTAAAPEAAATRVARLRWLAELGAESLVVSQRPAEARPRTIVASIPGVAYVFSVVADGSLQKRARLAADPAAPYGVAVTDSGVALADKQGSVGLWNISADGGLALRWRREVGDRVTSIGWNGSDLVLVATWKGRLLALAAADGRSLWSADIGGRAEAPGVVDGRDVYVATKARSFIRLDAATGAMRWKVALAGVALHPPVPFGQKPRLVLCGTWDGQILAHEALTGRVRWSATLPAKLAGAPVVAGELVAAVTADGTVHAYDLAGVLRWTAAGSAEGPATLLRPSSTGPSAALVSVSKRLVSLDLTTGARLADYPHGAAEDLKRRFADAMLDGVKTYSEAEKRVLLEREAFEISGPPFGPARLFGPHLAFGTEDGWTQVFDAATLRPRMSYRAGQACSGVPRLAAGQALAVAGEEVYALDPVTGRAVWKRVLGADPGRLTGEATLGVVAGGRVQALSAADGALQWSLRGGFRSLALPAGAAEESSAKTPWLVDDGEGNLRALMPPGRLVGDPLAAGGDLLPVLGASGRSWVVATREGRIFGVSWEETERGAPGRLVKSWETTFEERILGVDLANGRVLVRAESGPFASLDETSRQEVWRLRLSKEDRIQLLPQAGAVLVLGASEVRVHDWTSGEVRFQQKVPAPAMSADVRGTSLRWLDRGGVVHRVDVQGGRPVEITDLGVTLAEAVPTAGGFLVTTAAGEVGFVDVAEGEPAAAASNKEGSQ